MSWMYSAARTSGESQDDPSVAWIDGVWKMNGPTHCRRSHFKLISVRLTIPNRRSGQRQPELRTAADTLVGVGHVSDHARARHCSPVAVLLVSAAGTGPRTCSSATVLPSCH